MKPILPLSLFGCLFLLITSCKKDEQPTAKENDLPHTFTLVKRTLQSYDSTVYYFNSNQEVVLAVHANGDRDSFSYSQTAISYKRLNPKGLLVKAFAGYLNAAGYISETNEPNALEPFEYDSTGFFTRVWRYYFFNDSSRLNAIEMQSTQYHYQVTYTYHALDFKPYPFKLLVEDYDVLQPVTNPFIPSYYGRSYESLISMCSERWYGEIYSETTNTVTSYTYEVDENGYVTQLTASDGTSYTFSYK